MEVVESAMSLERAEVLRIVNEHDKQVYTEDVRFQRSSTLIFADGSVLHWSAAFLMRVDDYIVCLTEHEGTHIYAAENLLLYWESRRLHMPIVEMPRV